jgi:beta-glucosidase
LSYTTFDYQRLDSPERIREGEVLDLQLRIRNAGEMDSDEVVQLYVRYPDSAVERPLKALKGFTRIHIPAGQTITVPVRLDAEELMHWDTGAGKFVLEKGPLDLLIGASSADIRLEKRIRVE